MQPWSLIVVFHEVAKISHQYLAGENVPRILRTFELREDFLSFLGLEGVIGIALRLLDVVEFFLYEVFKQKRYFALLPFVDSLFPVFDLHGCLQTPLTESLLLVGSEVLQEPS